jgi:uncharacterized membrane protein YagU involved in acid resistance
LILATLAAGTLDLAYALGVSAWRGVAPATVCQGIASALLGPSALTGGAAMAWLGAGLHYAIMSVIVGCYYMLSRIWPQATRQVWLAGPLFGAGVFVVMNYVVVPLSAIGHAFRRPLWLFVGELFSHLVFVGVTIAWLVARARAGSPR